MSRSFDVFEARRSPPRALAHLEKQFGLNAEHFDGFAWYRRSGREDLWLLAAPSLAEFPETTHSVGFRVFNKPPPAGYPSATFLRRFHHLASRGIITLEGDAAARFARGIDVEHSSSERGYVIVRHRGMFLGRGFARADGRLDSQVANQFQLLDGDRLL